MPVLLASHSTSNGLLKAGSLKIGGIHMASLIFSKAGCASMAHLKVFPFVQSVIGVIMVLKFLINLW